jgi:hypothetical protein
LSIETWLTQAVTLRQRTGETVSDRGVSTPTYSTLETLMYLEPRQGDEDEENRNTGIGDWLGIGLASVPFANWDQVVYGSVVFDIVAPPRPFEIPGAGVDHIELDLQQIQLGENA